MAGILATFAADPNTALTVADIAMPAYGVELREVTKKHRVAVLRAMRRVCEVEPRFGLMNGEGPQGQMVTYDRTRVLSYGLARLKADWLSRYQWDVPRFWGDQPKSEKELRASLAPGGEDYHYVVEGGAWQGHCRAPQAEMAGDHEAASLLWEEQERQRRVFLETAKMFFGTRCHRPAPVRVASDQPDPPWDDEVAWRALWSRAEFKTQQRDLVRRRVRAAGGTVHRWHVIVPREVAFHRSGGWLDWWPAEAGFKNVFHAERAMDAVA